MESQYQHTTNGQAVYEADLNLLGENGALADDRVFAELLRMTPLGIDGGASVTKGVMPFKVNVHLGLAALPQCLVQAGTGGVTVHPFRAFVGSRAVVASGAKANWRDIRSAIMLGSTTALDTAVALDATAGGVQRIDMVYAAVTVDANDTGVVRKVKDPVTGQITTATVTATKSTTVTLGVVKGADNVTALPSIPSDAGGTYYIPLAYVHVPASFSGATAVAPENVWEVAPPVSLAESSGASSLRVANGNWDHNGTVQTRAPFVFAGRTPAAMPSVASGSTARLIAVDLHSATKSHNSGDIVDFSVDWRCRVFKVYASGIASGSSPDFPWRTTGANHVPSHAASKAWDMGQSFTSDTTLPSGATGAAVCVFDNTSLPAIAGGASVALYVDAADGNLRVDYSGTAPACKLFFWVEASAQMGNGA